MKFRLLALLLLLTMAVACATETAEEPAPVEEPAAMDDEAAVDAVRAAYVEHYNAGDADAVAALFTDDAVTLFSDGSVNMGREAIHTGLAEAIAGDPTASIESDEIMVVGDRAVTRGTYDVEIAPEGAEPMSFGGHYLTGMERQAGEWKIGLVVSNYDGPPAPGIPAASPPEENAPDLMDHALTDLIAAYAEHFNQGHADVVAAMYTEDAAVAFADMPMAHGREAVQAALQERIDAGNSLTIHTVGVEELGDGWYLAGGWYEATVGDQTRPGNWVTLVTTADDGSHLIHWAVTNLVHGAAE